jgi:uncharacterized membrane protein YsdA (DUF1294 family)
MNKIIIIYLIIINITSFILMLVDKRKAIKHKWRISEATLLGSAIIGGSIGMLSGMYLFRHKTKHLKFKLGGPIILILQVLCYIYFINL